MIRQRLFAFLAIAFLALAAVVPAGATAPGGRTVDPNSVTDIATNFVPRSLDTTPTDVVVHLNGQSVSEVQIALGRKTTGAEEDAIVSGLKHNQEALKGAINSAGGKVTDQFQYAIDGMRVRIPANQVSRLAKLPNVSEVLSVRKYNLDLTISVPYIGAPAVWNSGAGAPNMHGEGIKIGIIDTGMDYTHANFGGPGTAAAFNAAFANNTLPADPALFGPNAPKVKGGYDLVGDAYNANNPASVPVPDPNPLDCNGHGSHVGGIAAGFGVTASGDTYNGPYNSSIYTPGAFRIGPGVAPKADLYIYRVFGCSGSTNVVVDAIDRAVADHVDVISMSLGSDFGSGHDADSVAASNAARAGVIVVAASGNAGPNPYITSSPAAGDGAISVAANDPAASFPGAVFTTSTGVTMNVLDANGAVFADGTTYNIVTLVDNPATAVNESLGCNLTDYPSPLPANALVVANRGVCARVHKAIIGQQAGAAAVAMVNNASGLPVYEGAVFSDPDTGLPFTLTIPFFGVRGTAANPASDGAKLRAADGGTVTAVNATVSNPGFSAVASFSSAGPRIGDSYLKPEITAPGVSTYSTLSGSGNMGVYESGTSMATPHVAGVAALVKQAHPDWSETDLKAAIMNTASADAIAGYTTRSAGAGLVQPFGAVETNAVASGGSNGIVALNFGFQEMGGNLSQKGEVKVSNHGQSPVTFNISVSNQNGVPHTVTPSQKSITIRPREDADLKFTLNVPAATAGDSSSFNDTAGLITFTPVNGGNNGVALHVPYYLVQRPFANVSAKATNGVRVRVSSPTTSVVVSNRNNAAIPGNADFYAWGLHSAFTAGQAANNLRDVGVQVFADAAGPNNPLLVFGLNTYTRWSTPSQNEFDISVDVDPQNNNGDDYIVFSDDYGLITAGALSGQYGTFVYSLRSGHLSALNPANTFAPTDSSSASLVIIGSQLCVSGEPCLSPTSPRFTYHAASFNFFGTEGETLPGLASFNAYAPSITTGAFLSVAPGASASTDISINPAEWAQTPALGVLVLTTDNHSGATEAQEVNLILR